jgi:antitoxin component YwqK of YwqJK toxin-antitoxin module
MENFQEVKTSLIEQLKDSDACENLIKRVIKTQNWDELKEFIIADIWLFIGYNIKLPNGDYKNANSKFTVIDGKVHGKYVRYYNNGTLEFECSYVHGKKHGEYVRYYKHGQIEEKSTYKNGKRCGEHVIYKPDGNLYIKCKYINNELHGKYIRYHENGEVKFKCNYVNGELVEPVC